MSVAPVWERFLSSFRRALRDPALAPQLQSAADGARLRPWTELLTHAFVQACVATGWVCAAKGTGDSPLPVRPGEYLGVDVLAFPPGEGWRRPVVAIELENSPQLRRVAYATWKACSVAAELSCVMCYRREFDEIPGLLNVLADQVLGPLSPSQRVLVVVGTRGRSTTFPDDYFRTFHWDPTARRLRSGTRN